MAIIMYGLVPVYVPGTFFSVVTRQQPISPAESLVGVTLPFAAVLSVVLARRGRTTWGAWALAVVDVGAGLGIALFETNPLRALATSFFMLTGVVYASYLLSARATVAIAAAAALCMIGLPALHPTIEPSDMSLPILVTVLMSVVLALGSHLREQHVEEIERRTAESAATAERLRVTMDSSLDAVVTADAALRVVEWSVQAERLLRHARADVLGRDIVELLVPEPRRAEVRAALGRGTPSAGPVETEVLDAAGRTVPVEASVSPVRLADGPGMTVFLRDISERKQLQAERLLNDRLVSVGRLAAGVAHEINNPMSYVLSNLEYLEAVLPREDAERPGADTPQRAVREALAGARIVRDIVRDLRAFARGEDEALQPVDVRDVLDSTLRIARLELRRRGRIVCEYAEVPPVMASEGRLGQVFLNLVVNSAEALPEGPDGEVRVETARRPDGRVAVRVSDNGPGIAAHHLPRLFDPFFTTKPAGQGTGLGLYLSRSIVRALGGDVEVASTAGAGAAFTVVLPPAPPGSGRTEPVPAGGPLPAGLRILLVDDDAHVLAGLRRTLSAQTVAIANDGATALELCRRSSFDLVLTDVVMPGMSGLVLAERLAEEKLASDERVVLMSGAVLDPRQEAELARRPGRLLDKPIEAEELHALLRRAAARRDERARAAG